MTCRAEAARLPDSPSVSQDEPDYKSLFLSVREALEAAVDALLASHSIEPLRVEIEDCLEDERSQLVRDLKAIHRCILKAEKKAKAALASTALSVGGGGGISSVARAEVAASAGVKSDSAEGH